MSTINDRSQGQVQDPARPSAHKAPEPDNAAQFRQIQRGVDKPAAPAKRPLPERDRQDWHRG